jgi:hypothetical protein
MNVATRVDGLRPTRLTWLPVAIEAVAVLLIVYFDLQTNLSFNDDYARRWTLERMAAGKGLALWGPNPGLVQLAASAPLALSRLESRFWRLGAVRFLVLGMVASWRVALRLGADQFWAAIAGVGAAPVLAYNLEVFDRYYLAIAAPLAPVLAAMASGVRPAWRPAHAWALGRLAAGVAIYAAGQHDPRPGFDYTSLASGRVVVVF